MQDLLGRSRHRAQHRTPEVLVLEPHDEIGAAEVGKHESLAQPERRLRKLLHLLLLSRHDGALLPKPAEGEGVRILFGHEDGDLRDRRLPFENRLRRGAAVVLMALGDDGVEPHVLILQRMHELVRDDNPQLARADVGRDVERVGIGIVIAGDLFGEQVDHGGAQVQRLGNHPKQAQRRFQARQFGYQVGAGLSAEAVELQPHGLPALIVTEPKKT